MRPARSGSTLVEVLVACAIAALLLGLSLPAVSRGREASDRLHCLHNLRQFAVAVHDHYGVHQALPRYATGHPGTPFGGWWIALLPYVEQENVYRTIMETSHPVPWAGGFLGDSAVFSPAIHQAGSPILVCPSDPSRGHSDPTGPTGDHWSKTSYLANWYVFGNGIGGCYNPAQSFDGITDGLTNTVLFAEGYAQCGDLPRRACLSCDFHNLGITWDGKPSDDPSYLPEDYTMFQVRPRVKGGANPCDGLRSQTPHVAMQIALADGSARAVSPAISPATWKQLLKPRDGVPIGGDW
jgi:Protein of unknown function (DUF1559)/Prokaryotic N-terminal methylation motif